MKILFGFELCGLRPSLNKTHDILPINLDFHLIKNSVGRWPPRKLKQANICLEFAIYNKHFTNIKTHKMLLKQNKNISKPFSFIRGYSTKEWSWNIQVKIITNNSFINYGKEYIFFYAINTITKPFFSLVYRFSWLLKDSLVVLLF